MTERVMRLVDVEIVTTLGAKYAFPDMEAVLLDQVLRNVTRHDSLTLVNQSGACLVLGTRLIQTLSVDGTEKWRRPA